MNSTLTHAHPPTAGVMDGRAVARALLPGIEREIRDFDVEQGWRPRLAVVLVGADPDSVLYSQNVLRWMHRVGLEADLTELPADAPEAAVLAAVSGVSSDPAVNGVLVQMPVPPHISPSRVAYAIRPEKDVEGLHPENVGLLAAGLPRFVPTTPLAGLELLRAYDVPLSGRHAVILGRSGVVGRPLAQLLLQRDASVTILHSRSRGIPAHTVRADIVASAAGAAGLVTGAMVRPGAVVLDFGINFVGDAVVGDVLFEEVREVASLVTPVPGGIGPLTNLMIARNLLRAARDQSAGVASPGAAAAQ